jgi:hypothetical protein
MPDGIQATRPFQPSMNDKKIMRLPCGFPARNGDPPDFQIP